MSNIFLCSDHHFGHSSVITFVDNNNEIIRKFNHIDEHDEYLIEKHNSVVSENDRVYFLGDLVFSKKYIHLVGRMKGRKVLIKGNHDKLELKEYLPYFDDIRACHQFDGMFLSHVPIHPESLGRWGVNVHGHLHANRVMAEGFKYIAKTNSHSNSRYIDHRYQSVCMEQLDDYTPISLEQLKARIKNTLDR